MSDFKIVVQQHFDGFVAYHTGVNGMILGEGNTYEEAVADLKSAISFYIA